MHHVVLPVNEPWHQFGKIGGADADQGMLQEEPDRRAVELKTRVHDKVLDALRPSQWHKIQHRRGQHEDETAERYRGTSYIAPRSHEDDEQQAGGCADPGTAAP